MAKELELKYGCNPNQKPARIYITRGPSRKNHSLKNGLKLSLSMNH